MPPHPEFDGSSIGMTPDAIHQLHHQAGAFADEVINEARHANLLLVETGAEGQSTAGGKKWDASVPEIHLKSYKPDDLLSTELEVVDRLESHRPGLSHEELTAPQSLMAAFPRSSPAILGEDHSFIQHQQANQVTQQNQADQHVQAVVVATIDADSESESDTQTEADSDSSILTDAEVAAGVVTMADLKDMMELEGMSHTEIDQYMENLGHTVVEAEVTASNEAEGESEGESASETNQETEAEVEAESEVEAAVEAETEQETETEGEGEAESESDSQSDSQSGSEYTADQLAAYAAESAASGIPATELLEIEQQAQQEEEARLAAQAEADQQQSAGEDAALVEQQSDADAFSDMESESESMMASDMDAAAEAEAESEAYANQSDDVVHVHSQSAPSVLQESMSSTVTPIRSSRGEPLNRVAIVGPSGYSLPNPTSMVETAAATHSRQSIRQQSYQRQQSTTGEYDPSRFNPSGIQLGPSKDAYGYVPMTGAEFLHSPQQPASLAQISMQMQHQQGQWLPPPIEQHAVPNFVVGMGGLMPNRNAGPYQGQYGLAAGGQPLPQEPTFIQYN